MRGWRLAPAANLAAGLPLALYLLERLERGQC